MRVLLFNENPVVTKLVTLSAQKAGHTLQLCKDASQLEGASYDLLIVDDALYNEQNMTLLGEKLQVRHKLLMANRGVAKPDAFDYLIYKPFLPTDLVELLASIAAALRSAPSSAEPVHEDASSDEAFEGVDDFEGLDQLEAFDDEELSHEAFELDQLEADESPTLVLEHLVDEQEDFEALLDDAAVSDGVLDKEEVAELQSLLEDTESPPDTEIEIEEIDNIDGLGDTDVNLGLEPAAPVGVSADDEEEIDLSEFEDLESAVEADAADEPLVQTEAIEDADDASDLEEETVLGSLDESVDMDDLDEPDTDAFAGLDDEIARAVSDLSDDDMEMEFDDETLEALDLDEITSTKEQGGSWGNEIFDLDSLDEQSLKRALGEADALLEEPLEADFPSKEADEHTDAIAKPANAEGVEALKVLLKALEQQDVAKALKGMNITVNISFGASE